jgi:hypothetical protein
MIRTTNNIFPEVIFAIHLDRGDEKTRWTSKSSTET